MASSSNPPPARGRSRGRQKIEIKKMSNKSQLQVTFSKRRNSLFRKASELCTLCGAEVALVVFSPGEKVYSFGHPNVEAVVERHLNGDTPQPRTISAQIMEDQRNAKVRLLNAQLTRVMAQLEVENKRSEELRKRRKEMEEKSWLAAPYDTLTSEQLAVVKARLEKMKRTITREVDRALIQKAANIANLTPRFYAGSSSSSSLPPPPLQMAVPPPPAQEFSPPLPPMIQHPVFDGNMLPPPSLPPPGGFGPFDNMGGYGGSGQQYY